MPWEHTASSLRHRAFVLAPHCHGAERNLAFKGRGVAD